MIRVGTVVKVKNNIHSIQNTVGIADKMTEYEGLTANVIRVSSVSRGFPVISLDIDNGRWSWEDSLLEVISMPKQDTIEEKYKKLKEVLV